MGKIMTWTMILVAMVFIMNLAFNTNTSWMMGQIIGFEGTGNFSGTAFFVAIVTALGFLGAVGIIAGLLSGGRIDTALLMRSSFATAVLFVFVNDFTSVLATLRGTACLAGGACSWEFYVGALIMVTMIAGYCISIIDWVGGTEA